MIRLSAAELCRKYRNETVHTEHVTRLGLMLFDAVRSRLSIDGSERRLVETACRLHDVGFATVSDPADHHSAGARIIMTEGMPDFSNEQRMTVAGATLLHRLSYKEMLADELFGAVRDYRRVLRVASFLRVADALDHGHIQHVSIESVRFGRGAVNVGLRADGDPDPIAYAVAKSDLWNKVFQARISFSRSPSGKTRKGTVRKGDTVLSAARRIMYFQYYLGNDARKRMIKGGDAEAIHDMRVAMNRFRAAYKMFERHLNDVPAGNVIGSIKGLRSRLGKARDAEVWLEFLKEASRRGRTGKTPSWKRYLQTQEDMTNRARAEVSDLAAGPEYAAVNSRSAALLRTELPALEESRPSGAFRAFAADCLAESYRRMLQKTVNPGKASAAELHRLRQKCKRLRYWAEFAEPVFGAAVSGLARRLKRVTGALGDVHDMDVNLGRRGTGNAPKPRGLNGLIVEHRTHALAEAVRAWREIADPGFRNRLTKALSKKD